MSEDKWTIERVDDRPMLYRWGELYPPPKNSTIWFHDEMQEAREKVKALQARVDELESGAEMWAVYQEERPSCIGNTKNQATKRVQILTSRWWPELEDEGWRCVKVVVREVSDLK